MVMTTGNKSELSVGYATLYGDMNGGFNRSRICTRPRSFRFQSAAKRMEAGWGAGSGRAHHSGQRHKQAADGGIAREPEGPDSLPPYDLLDAILERLVEWEEPVAKIVEAGFDRDIVMRIDRMLNLAEYKRRQAAPGVKVTLRGFGRDRRYPITNRFRDPGTALPRPDASLVSGAPAKSEAFDF